MAARVEKEKRVSVYTVAEAVGVSVSTVSRVINNDARVKPDTVLAVREAIERLDYRPMPVMNRPGPRVRRRKPIRRQQLALLFGGRPVQLHTPVYSRVVQGIEERMREEGWNLVVRTLPTDRPWEAMPHRLDGVLLFSVDTSEPRFMRELRRTPAVKIMGQPSGRDFFDHVTYDDDKIGQAAAEYLTGKGHRQLVSLYGTRQGRVARFIEVARDANAEITEMVVPDLIYESGKVQVVNRQTMAEVTARILGLESRPTGIYVGADVIAAGLHPGVDIEIVGTNNDAAILDHLHPRPASVDIHAEEIGRRGVEQLFWRLDHSREPCQVIQLEPEIIRGEEP